MTLRTLLLNISGLSRQISFFLSRVYNICLKYFSKSLTFVKSFGLLLYSQVLVYYISLKYFSEAKVLWTLRGCCCILKWLKLKLKLTFVAICSSCFGRPAFAIIISIYSSIIPQFLVITLKRDSLGREVRVWKQIQVISLSSALRMAIKLRASFRTYFTWNMGNKFGENAWDWPPPGTHS